METSQKKFEEDLLKHGIITDAELAGLRARAIESGKPLEQMVMSERPASERSVVEIFAQCNGVACALELHSMVNPELVRSVPARFATHYRFVPLYERDGALYIAVVDPFDMHNLDEIRMVLKRRIEPVMSPPGEIAKAIKQYFGIGADTVERILYDVDKTEVAGSAPRTDWRLESAAQANIAEVGGDASIIRVVNQLLMDAIQNGATDIHIEPFEDELRVRYRIDGILYRIPTAPAIRDFHSAIVSRIKIMAELNIAEYRIPQDGRIRVNLDGNDYDLRVSVLPTPFGETVNIRILSRASMFFGLEQLGLSTGNLGLLNSIIRKPHGIILATGPTGSGKTTTLYACLQKINTEDQKIITIEDPIEYQLKGINQMQVLPQIGFTFARGLRSMLRHDPDVMMVGEIRDRETAEIAIQSALTGHLVFSTLHTNDAPGAITRLIDMGIEPFLITSTVIASVAQRLVRRICSACKEEYKPDRELLRRMGATESDETDSGLRLMHGRGCEQCKYTGYSGRIALYEFLLMWDEIKELTLTRAGTNLIRDKARQLGMLTLKEDGWRRVKAGTTTVEEVLRVAESYDEFQPNVTTDTLS